MSEQGTGMLYYPRESLGRSYEIRFQDMVERFQAKDESLGTTTSEHLNFMLKQLRQLHQIKVAPTDNAEEIMANTAAWKYFNELRKIAQEANSKKIPQKAIDELFVLPLVSLISFYTLGQENKFPSNTQELLFDTTK